MMLEKSVMFPPLHATVREVLDSSEEQIVKLILEPLSLPVLYHFSKVHGARFIAQLSYLSRTFAFYIDRQYKQVLKQLKTSPSQHRVFGGTSSNTFPVTVTPPDQTSVTRTNQLLPGPGLTVLQSGQACHPNHCSAKPASECPSCVASPVPHQVQDNSCYKQLVTGLTVTMTMTGKPITSQPLSHPLSATHFPRDDRAILRPVALVTDSVVCSSNTTPAAPSLTPPAASQHSRFAAPWSGHRSTVAGQVSRVSSVVTRSH